MDDQPELQHQAPDGTWHKAESLPAPWLVRVQKGELNGWGQRVLAAPVLGVLVLWHWAADVRRQWRDRRA